MDSIHYNNRKLRIGAALAASVYIVLHGRINLFFKAVISVGFYVAVTVSFIIALLLVYYVHSVTIWLDKILDWRNSPVKRSTLQLVLGVITPTFLDIFFISIYFSIIGQNILENGFFLIDLPIIISFLIILNLYYLIHYLLLTEPKNIVSISKDSREPIQSKTLAIEGDGTMMQFDVGQDILYVYRFKNHVNLFAFNGKEYPMKETLATVAEQFTDCGFIQINRSLALNFSIVEGYQPGPRRNTLELIFKRKYSGLLESQGIDRFIVTKEHIEKVKDFFERF
ncbi:LytTR family transcriptional regulator DNA-binding domain-containing protein [Chryseobacterium sp. SL1]|uniref:LytTR family transcriptional regulator DNA-binding domain-containing protein n=1 Tax=Chryseobacterium sp. SL1 TaxID=2995159 RepID=UPI002272F1FA|nr:LytTR family transcriptional regulator DNA-binding domain-containing protein [Chryseobacterium sp. SL1]MCY1662574.1 LytTR family transcriptional regulator DNA-binding domain-containing protein [Chryseobacterium sp. SL1]